MKPTRINFFMITLFFGAFGIATEVFFTALTSFFSGHIIMDKPPLALTGFTYVWMLPIYMLIPFLFRAILPRLIHLHVVIRILIYVMVIYLIEFTSGFLLDQITGSCPWEYTTGWHVMGYIRLDYFPAWAFFAFLIEKMYRYLSNIE